jgi:drug/metabolite transporter (DMT)-like permease
MGFVAGLLGFTLFFVGLHSVSTARASNLAFFELPVAVGVSAFVLREPLQWTTIVGGAIIAISVIISRRVR